MSVISLATGEPTCTVDDLHAAARANNFTIEPGSANEAAYLLFANSFDAVCKMVDDLPEYLDPRTAPVDVEGGRREYLRPSAAENPLNAWMYRTRLRAADPRARAGPLAGRTMAVKDNMCVAGLPIGLGASPKLFEGGKHPISPIDAVAVRRVMEAGATITGTATCENFSIFATSYTSDAGAVHNPWQPGYATGGSSSGCGALVSVGSVKSARYTGLDRGDYPLGECVDLALGADQGGSIRLPAAYAGIYGLKPTFGLVPYTGIAPFGPMMDHVGPLARTVEDIATFLGVIAGYDGMDPRMTPESPLRSQVPDYIGDLSLWMADKQRRHEWNPSHAARGLRIGVLRESFEIMKLDSSVAAALQNAIAQFRRLGADVREVSVPFHRYGAAIWTVATRPLIPHHIASKVPDQLSHTMPHIDPSPVDQTFYDITGNRNPNPVNILMNKVQMEQNYGSRLARKSYMHIFQLRAAYDAALQDLDILLTPMTPTVAPKIPASALHTPQNPFGRSERIMDLFEPVIGVTLNTSPFNITGHPAMSMPVGWGTSSDGNNVRLPVGMQIIAKRWDEAVLLRAAKAWEVGGKWMDK